MSQFDDILTKQFKTQRTIKAPRLSVILSRMVMFGLTFSILVLAFVPWRQFSIGQGIVIGLDPNKRIQEINSTISGRITRWFVKDGDIVNLGDPIVEITDVDPNLVMRLQQETTAKERNVEVARIAADTAKRDLVRQEELFNLGLSSRKQFEQATIHYKKLLSDVATYEAELAKARISLSRQEIRIIKANDKGTILRVIPGSGSIIVKEGDLLATFLPDSEDLAVEVFVPGIDLPLINESREARIQFEGWPAIQFGGWPSTAIGTFSGKVLSVDPSSIKEGKYRVIITPDRKDKWPSQRFLRQGSRAYAWILLDQVSIGYEIWRRINGLPMSSEELKIEYETNLKKK